jgi:hypothetical protein
VAGNGLQRTTAAKRGRCRGELRSRLLGAVRLDVMLGGFLGVMRRVHVVTLRQVGMVRCRLVIAVLVMLGSFPVMVGRMFMVLGGLGVMMRSFLRHDVISFRLKDSKWRAGICQHCRKPRLQPNCEPVNYW